MFWFSSLFLSPCLTFHPSSSFSSFILLYLSSFFLLLLFHPLPGLTGPRPYGLEEDVRQYEQDLAKRLYQARVRASQGTPETPQLPTSSSAASQLRSAPRPQLLGPDAQHRGGVLGCFAVLGILLETEFRKVQASTCSITVTVLPSPF